MSTRRSPPPPTSLSPDDQLEWDALAKTIKPLHPVPVVTPPLSPMPSPKPAQPLPVIPPSTRASVPPPHLIVNTLVHMDHRLAARLKRGEIPIDMRIDLHGYNREAALTHLVQAIPQAYDRGKRCLLVITGKGAGVLREALPNWLNTPTLRPFVLGVHEASLKHGGKGAFYVLLARKR